MNYERTQKCFIYANANVTADLFRHECHLYDACRYFNTVRV